MIGLNTVENYLLVPHEMGREPDTVFCMYSDSRRHISFDSFISQIEENVCDGSCLTNSVPTVFHSESDIVRKISPRLYEDPKAPLIVTKRTLRDPLVDLVNSEYLSFLARGLSMYFRITILIDEAFHTIKSNDSVTEWSSKDSNDPMLLEGSSPVEARLLGATCPVTFFKELELEHSNISQLI